MCSFCEMLPPDQRLYRGAIYFLQPCRIQRTAVLQQRVLSTVTRPAQSLSAFSRVLRRHQRLRRGAICFLCAASAHCRPPAAPPAIARKAERSDHSRTAHHEAIKLAPQLHLLPAAILHPAQCRSPAATPACSDKTFAVSSSCLLYCHQTSVSTAAPAASRSCSTPALCRSPAATPAVVEGKDD